MHARLLPALVALVVLIGESLAMRSIPRSTAAQPTLPDQNAVPARPTTASPAARTGDSVLVTTETVTARVIEPPRAASVRVSHPTPRVERSRVPKRSLFARVLLGNGDTRPRPFPRPGS